LKQIAEQSVVDVDYDIGLVTQDMDESELLQLYDELKTAAGVYESSYQAMMTYSIAVKASDFSERYREFAGYAAPDETDNLLMDVQFIEDSHYWRFIESLGLPAEEYTGENAKVTVAAKVNLYDEAAGKNALFDLFAERAGTFRLIPVISGESLEEQGQDAEMTFVDTIPLDPLPREAAASQQVAVLMLVAPYQLKERFAVPGEREELGLTFRSETPAQSAAQMEEMIQGLGVTAEYTLHRVYAILEQNRNIIFIVEVFSAVFVVMMALIATANVFNTIATNIRLRRRELAMLRSVGMSERDFQKMMHFECAFYGLRTLMFGLPIAVILSWLIYQGLFSGGADIGFTLPWSSIGVSGLGVFLVVFMTMLYATGKIKRENIIDALRDEMA
jgi:putative ABC transport system permease protein